jgi:hypothetical protein
VDPDPEKKRYYKISCVVELDLLFGRLDAYLGV